MSELRYYSVVSYYHRLILFRSGFSVAGLIIVTFRNKFRHFYDVTDHVCLVQIKTAVRSVFNQNATCFREHYTRYESKLCGSRLAAVSERKTNSASPLAH